MTEQNVDSIAARRSLDPVVITLGEFEEIFKALPAQRAFIFAKYKGRWKATDAQFNNNGNIMYFFFDDPKNCMMAECITSVSIPTKPSYGI